MSRVLAKVIRLSQGIRSWPMIKRQPVLWLGLVLVALTVGFIITLQIAHAQFTSFTVVGNGLIWAFSQLFLAAARLAMSVTVFFLQLFIQLAAYNNFIDAPPVVIGWLMVRDVANMFFVVALLVIAFGTILGLEQYEWKKTLLKLILAAIFINFSKLILQLVIDVAHVFTTTFLNAIVATAGGNLITMFHLDKVLQLTPRDLTFGNSGDDLRIDLFIGALMGAIFAIMAMVIIGSYLIVMLIRMVVLWVLIILSPLAFIAQVLPNTKSFAEEYWKEFTHHVIVAPVMVFFLWLTFATLGAGDIASVVAPDLAPDDAQAIAGQSDLALSSTISLSEASTWENFASFLITLGFLFVGLDRVQKLGVKGGGIVSGAVNFGKKVATIATGYAAGRYLVGEGIKFGKEHIQDTYGQFAKGKIKLAKEKALLNLSRRGGIIGAIVRTPKRLAKHGAIAEETAKSIADIRSKEIASGDYGVERSRYRGQLQTLSLRGEKRDRERDTREAVEFAKTHRYKDGKQGKETFFQEIGGHEVAAAGVESEKKQLEQQAENKVLAYGRDKLKEHEEKKDALRDSLKTPEQKELEGALANAEPGLSTKREALQQKYNNEEAKVRDGDEFKGITEIAGDLEADQLKLADIKANVNAKVKLEGAVGRLETKRQELADRLDGGQITGDDKITEAREKLADFDKKIENGQNKIKEYDNKLPSADDKELIENDIKDQEAQLKSLKEKLADEVAKVVQERKQVFVNLEEGEKVKVGDKELSVADARVKLSGIEAEQEKQGKDKESEYAKKKKAIEERNEKLDEEFIEENTTKPKIFNPKTGKEENNPLYASIKYIYGHAAATTATAEREQAAGLLEVDAHHLSPIETIVHKGIAAEVGSEAAKKFVEGIKNSELKNKFKQAGDTILDSLNQGVDGLKALDQSEDTYVRALRQTKLAEAETEDAGISRADAETIAGGAFVEAKAAGYSTPSAALVNIAKRLGDALRKLDQPARADKATKNFANLAGLRAKGADIGTREKAHAFGTLHNLVDEANVDDHLGDVVKKFKRLEEKPDTFKPEERASLQALKDAYKSLGVITVNKDGKFERSLNNAESMNRIQNWVLAGGDTEQIQHHIGIQSKMKELDTKNYQRGMNEYFGALPADGAKAMADFVTKLREQETLLTDASQDFINAAKQAGHLQNGGHQQFDSDLGFARYATVDESVKTMIGQVIKNQGLGRKLNFQSFGDVDADKFVLTRVDERMAAAALGKIRSAPEAGQILDRTVDTLTGYGVGEAAKGNKLGGSAVDLQSNFGSSTDPSGRKNFVRDVIIPQLIGSPEALALIAFRKFGNVNKIAAENGAIDVSVDGDANLQDVKSIKQLIENIKNNIGNYVDTDQQKDILAKLENSLQRVSRQNSASSKYKKTDDEDDEEENDLFV